MDQKNCGKGDGNVGSNSCNMLCLKQSTASDLERNKEKHFHQSGDALSKRYEIVKDNINH